MHLKYYYNKRRENMIKVTGLWVNETSSGEKYFGGSLGGCRVLIFKNKFKKKDSEPDYTLNFAPNTKKEESQQPLTNQEVVERLEQDIDDDVPF